jgi:hypothetical protein
MDRKMQSPVSMTPSAAGRTLIKLAVAIAALGAFSCASGDDGPGLPPPAGGGATGGSGGEPGSGPGGDPTTTTGSGQTPPPDCSNPGDAPIDPETLPECPNCTAGGAHCVPTSLVPPDAQSQLGDCDATSKCVPDELIETNGLFVPTTCDSIFGAEGRCLSRCLPSVQEQEAQLPQDVCDPDDVCVPCYNPLNQMATGACALSCDPGPVEPPASLPKCCGGQGTCVPPEAAGDQADQLGEDECPQDNGALVCAPDVFINDPNWHPAACTTGLISQFFGDEYEPGACLPDCLPAVDNFLIGQDDCPDGFKCAPCLKPPFGESSGACEL